MEEVQADIGHVLAVICAVEEAGIREGADDCGFHSHGAGELEELRDLLFRDGQGHAFLGLGEQDLPWAQAMIFQERFFQFYMAPAA